MGGGPANAHPALLRHHGTGSWREIGPGARFKNKTEMLSDIDFLDVTVRQETMNNVPGQQIQLQLGVVPCCALTVRKTQARGFP